MQHIVRRLAAVAVVAATPPAHAEWLKATSRHFVVYANTSQPLLLEKTTALENFDAALRYFQRMPENADAEFNRVTVYVLPDIAAVQRLAGLRNAAGLYLPRVAGSVAFTPQAGGNGTGALWPRIVLFHEYAHHFLFGNFANAYPAWFAEGYAEFASTMFEKGGRFWIGGAAMHRGYDLLNGTPLPIRQLLDPPAKMNEGQVQALYGRGWLLTHYLMFDEGRRKQFARYLDLFNAGTPSVAAATEAFGDLDGLDRRLDGYLQRRGIPAMGLDTKMFAVPVIAIRPLSGGERALIALRIESDYGVDKRSAGPLFAKAKVAAAPFPRDAVAQGWLAEMAFDADEFAAADAAADAALAVDPASSQALLYKARIRLRGAVQAGVTDPAIWAEARSWIIRANRAMPNDAAALALYYDSFEAEKAKPGRNAIRGLYRASALAPQDRSLRFQAARQLILDGDVARARNTLRAIAADPHGGADNAAAQLLALLDAGQTGQAALDALAKAAKTANGKEKGGT